MEGIIKKNELYHRSKQRIKELGEVFTPNSYADDMLKILGQNGSFSWDDEKIAFFEPCCGHGNIVISIFSKRLDAMFSKSLAKNPIGYAAYYSIANSINSLWAIDIDPQNIEECRARIFIKSIEFLKDKLNLQNNSDLIKRDKDYMVHLLCAIYWHIHENEMLSAMTSNKKMSELCAKKTKTSTEWLSENKHCPINFNLSWIEYFKKRRLKQSLPTLYKHALQFIENISSYQAKKYGFHFASILMSKNINITQKYNDNEILGELWNQI